MSERGSNAEVNLTLIGGPTLLIERGGLRLLTDPSFDAPQAYEGAVRLVKRTGPALPARDVLPIDAVLLSHDQHADNLDNDGRTLLPLAGRVFTTPAGASRLGGNAEGFERVAVCDAGDTVGRCAAGDGDAGAARTSRLRADQRRRHRVRADARGR
jgi:L-ascorbate metabolism protein UlaG (beta-lactamase superfamily)